MGCVKHEIRLFLKGMGEFHVPCGKIRPEGMPVMRASIRLRQGSGIIPICWDETNVSMAWHVY